MNPQLLHTPMKAEDLYVLRGLQFGDKNYEIELRTWLDEEAEGFIKEQNGTIWAHMTLNGDIIGYSSLGFDSWNLTSPIRETVDILYIPAIAIDVRFHSAFKGQIESGRRYPAQIMNNILDVAIERKKHRQKIGLLTHPENEKANCIYKKYNFERSFPDHIDQPSKAPYWRWTRNI